MRKPDPEHLERGASRAVEPAPTSTAESAPGARPCQMMTGSPDGADERCGATPTVGGNGAFRYCKAHLVQVERAGGVVYRDGWA